MRTRRNRDTPGRQWQRWALLGGTVPVLAGCASMKATAGAPLTSIDAIAGHWAGGQRTFGLDDLRDSFTARAMAPC
jgi:hypothetical protein